MNSVIRKLILTLGLVCLSAANGFADTPPPTIDKADTAWMLVSTALVLMMTIPGLALFYGGLVRKENVLATLMQSFAIVCIVGVLWPAVAYTLAFAEGATPYLGGLAKAMLKGIEPATLSGTIPESVFVMYQYTFAAITVALMMGSVTDRIKFTALLLLAPLWLICVYCPIAHWVWGPAGWIGGTGLTGYAGILGFGAALDFAGGTVVHINSGVAALVMALVLGKRSDHGKTQYIPHNLVLSVIGASLLWVGWFGFNAGSAVAANERAGMAMLVTNTAAAAAGLTWVIIEIVHRGKASVLGAISGAVVGLVAITPASGFVGVEGSLAIGVLGGLASYFAVTTLKAKCKYDDSLDVFGVHGVGGAIGAILTGVFATANIGGASGWVEGNFNQVIAQVIAVGITVVYCAVVTYILLKIVDLTVGLRVDRETEKTGLDLALHGERVPHG